VINRSITANRSGCGRILVRDGTRMTGCPAAEMQLPNETLPMES
jgi:hypothetical protein